MVTSLHSSEIPSAPSMLFSGRFWWINLFSIDAVGVAFAWQFLFTRQFCERFPSPSETIALGLTVWIAYTADRLLDARRLDLTRPHTLRHRVHREFCRPLTFIWIAAVVVNLTLISIIATTTQLCWGLSCLVLVVAYIKRIQRCRRPRRGWLPKEMQAGLLFGFGVSLLAWSETPAQSVAKLSICTGMSGLLFTMNCASIAYWDREQDRAQGFDSWLCLPSNSLPLLWMGIGCHIALTACLYVVGEIPPSFATALGMSGGLLLMVVITHVFDSAPPTTEKKVVTTPSVWQSLADASLFIPPAFVVTWNFVAS